MDASPLATLPGELRNRIWRLVVVKLNAINVSDLTSPQEPALLATCHQARKEASGIYYAENTFLLAHDPFALRIESSWLRALGPARARQLHDLRLDSDVDRLVL